jgi:hypothetical protein
MLSMTISTVHLLTQQKQSTRVGQNRCRRRHLLRLRPRPRPHREGRSAIAGGAGAFPERRWAGDRAVEEEGKCSVLWSGRQIGESSLVNRAQPCFPTNRTTRTGSVLIYLQGFGWREGVHPITRRFNFTSGLLPLKPNEASKEKGESLFWGTDAQQKRIG